MFAQGEVDSIDRGALPPQLARKLFFSTPEDSDTSSEITYIPIVRERERLLSSDLIVLLVLVFSAQPLFASKQRYNTPNKSDQPPRVVCVNSPSGLQEDSLRSAEPFPL